MPSKSESLPRTLLFAANAFCTLLLMASLALDYLWPEEMRRFHLDAHAFQMITLELISLLLLLGWLQRNLKPAWRIFALAGAFVVLVESWLIALS